MRRPWFLLPATLLSLSACNEHPLKEVELSRTSETRIEVDIAPLRNVDILVVIDNSASMAAEQANLAANLAPMLERLEQEDVAADYRIAVTTTDVDDGACAATGPEDGRFIASSCRSRTEQFQTPPQFEPFEDARESACFSLCPESLAELETLPTRVKSGGEAASRPWIENILGKTNLPEGVSTQQAFACMGPQGINGCGFEAPLRAMQRSLTRAQRAGEPESGFLRDDALLLVIFVTDEADCSVPGRLSGDLYQAGSTGCWNAGVSCTQMPDGSLDCVSANQDLEGNEVSPEDAVLRPVEEYVELLEAIQQHKREATGNEDLVVMVSLVAGVPTEYPGADITYSRGTPFADEYGIDPGCASAFGDAVPPVRLLEFAEAFAGDADSSVSSVCAASYGPAMEEVARRLEEAFEPACADTCLAGGSEHDCVFSQSAPGEDKTLVPSCAVGEDGSHRLPEGADVCVYVALDEARAPACVETNAAVEFVPLYRPGVARVPGSSISATCSVSEAAEVECPWVRQ